MRRPSVPGAGPARRWVGGVVCGALVAGVVAGCTTARSDLGTSDSACYLVLPTATKAIHGQGRLLGVHQSTVKALSRQAPELLAELSTEAAPTQRICVAAFGGHYTTESVAEPRGLPSGELAVVVSTTPENHLLGTIILTRPPLRFGHSHIG